MTSEKRQPVLGNVYVLFPEVYPAVLEAIKPSRTVPDPDNWKASGACAIANPEIFVDQDEESLKAAKAICSVCDVRVECLGDALRTRAKGTHGGYSERERRKILRERSRMSR